MGKTSNEEHTTNHNQKKQCRLLGNTHFIKTAHKIAQRISHQFAPNQERKSHPQGIH